MLTPMPPMPRQPHPIRGFERAIGSAKVVAVIQRASPKGDAPYEQPHGKACRTSVVVALLLVIHSGLLAYSAYVHSPTLNEPGHLVAGISHWRFELFRVNPPLVRMVAALPVMVAGVETDWSNFYDGPGARPVFSMGGESDRGQRREVVRPVYVGSLGVRPLQLDWRHRLFCLGTRSVRANGRSPGDDPLVLLTEHPCPCFPDHRRRSRGCPVPGSLLRILEMGTAPDLAIDISCRGCLGSASLLAVGWLACPAGSHGTGEADLSTMTVGQVICGEYDASALGKTIECFRQPVGCPSAWAGTSSISVGITIQGNLAVVSASGTASVTISLPNPNGCNPQGFVARERCSTRYGAEPMSNPGRWLRTRFVACPKYRGGVCTNQTKTLGIPIPATQLALTNAAVDTMPGGGLAIPDVPVGTTFPVTGVYCLVDGNTVSHSYSPGTTGVGVHYEVPDQNCVTSP
jgi:hypothetical protein